MASFALNCPVCACAINLAVRDGKKDRRIERTDGTNEGDQLFVFCSSPMRSTGVHVVGGANNTRTRDTRTAVSNIV